MTSEKIQRLIYALDEALKTGDHAKEYTAAKVLIRETGISDRRRLFRREIKKQKEVQENETDQHCRGRSIA